MSNTSHSFKPTQYFNPTELSEAVKILSDIGSGAYVIAGGTDLLVEKSPEVEALVDLKSLGLSYVEECAEGIKIGAATIFSDIEKSFLSGKNPYHILAEAAGLVGTPQIRNMGTIGGNICRTSPCSDMSPVLLALNAIVKIAGPEGTRELPVMDFFKGVRKDALNPGEIVTEIFIPAVSEKSGSAFIKLGRVAVSDLSIINVATCVEMDSNNICTDVRIALGAVAPTPIRVLNAEKVLRGKKLVDGILEEAALVASNEIQPITDIRATAEYRRDVSRVLVKRALESSLSKIGISTGEGA